MNTKDKHNDLGFEVPDGYFESMENKLLASLDTKEQAGFKVPDGYFENLESRLLTHTKEVEIKVVALNAHKRTWLAPLLAVAALLVIVLTINGLYNKNAVETTNLASVENDELMEFLLNEPHLEDTATLSYLYAATDLPVQETLVNDVEDEELIEYLMNNVDDNSFLEQ